MKEERSNWRDAELSERHRIWGDDVPIVDIDWIVCDYDQRIPVAIIDYKKGLNWIELARDRSNLAALSELASGYRKGIPFLIVRYDKDPWRFKIEPRNYVAKKLSVDPATFKTLNELDYVHFHYWLRGRPIPEIVRPLLGSGPV